MSVGETIIGAVNQFANTRENQLNRAIAAESAKLVSDLQLSATEKLRQDAATMEPGTFNADSQLQWFKQESEKIAGLVESKEARLQVRSLLDKAQANFYNDASAFELKSSQLKEKKNIDDWFDNSIKSLQLAIAEGRDASGALLQSMQVGAVYENSFTDNAEYYHEKLDEMQYLAGTMQIADVKNKIAKGEASLSELDTLMTKFAKEEIYGSIGGKRRTSLVKEILSATDSSKSDALKEFTRYAKARKETYVQSLRDGRPVEEIFEQGVFNSTDPTLRAFAARIQLQHETDDFWTDLRNGQTDDLFVRLQAYKSKLLQGDDEFGAKRQMIEDMETAYNTAIAQPTGYTLENNPAYQSALMAGVAEGDFTQAARMVENVARGLSYDDFYIEPLTKSFAANYASRIAKGDSNDILKLAKEIDTQWSGKYESGMPIAQSVINQLFNENEKNPISDVILGLSYRNTPQASTIISAAKTSMSDAMMALGVSGAAKFIGSVKTKLEDHLEYDLAAGIDKAEAFVKSNVNLTIKLAARLVTDGVESNDDDSAIDSAIDILYKQTREEFTLGDGWGRNARSSKTRVAVTIPTEFKNKSQLIKSKLRSRNIGIQIFDKIINQHNFERSSFTTNQLQQYGIENPKKEISLYSDAKEILDMKIPMLAKYEGLQLKAILSAAKVVNAPGGQGVMLLVRDMEYPSEFGPLVLKNGKIAQWGYDRFGELD